MSTGPNDNALILLKSVYRHVFGWAAVTAGAIALGISVGRGAALVFTALSGLLLACGFVLLVTSLDMSAAKKLSGKHDGDR